MVEDGCDIMMNRKLVYRTPAESRLDSSTTLPPPLYGWVDVYQKDTEGFIPSRYLYAFRTYISPGILGAICG